MDSVYILNKTVPQLEAVNCETTGLWKQSAFRIIQLCSVL